MLTVHIIAVCFAFVSIAVADKQALAWLSGRKEVLSHATLTRMHLFTWGCLLTVITTGILLAYPMLGFLIHSPAFLAKMCFVGILLTNAVLIGSLMRVSGERSFVSLSMQERLPLLLSGAISTVAWCGALTLAFFIF